MARAYPDPAAGLPGWLLAVVHPKVWLTLFGGVFTLAYSLMSLGYGGLYGVFRSNAVSQWSDATDAELEIATAYEGFWCGALLSLSLLALSFAWLFRGKTQATLALVFGTVMLACFLPGLIFVSSRYRLHCASGSDSGAAADDATRSYVAHCHLGWAWGAMATVFGLIALSGLLHLHIDENYQLLLNGSGQAPGYGTSHH